MNRQNSSLLISDIYLRKGINSFFLLLIAFCIQFCVNLIVANWLGASAFGDYVISINVIKLMASIGLLGFNYSVYRFLPQYFAKGKWQHVRSFFYQAIRYIFFILLFIIACTNGFIYFAQVKPTIQSITHTYLYHPLLLAVWFAPMLAMIYFFSAILRTQQHFYIAETSKRVLIPLVTLFILLIFASKFYLHYVEQAILLYGLALFVILIVLAYLVYKLLPKQVWQHKNVTIHESLWISISLQLFIDGFMFLSLLQIELYFLEFFNHDEALVGLFAAYQSIMAFMWLVTRAVSILIKPNVASLTQYHDKQYLRQYCRQAFNLLNILVIIIFVILLLFSKPLLHLFGSQFHLYLWPYMIMLLGSLFGSISANSVDLLSQGNYHRAVVKGSVLFFVCSVLINAGLIYYYGLIGAAIGFAFIRLGINIYNGIVFRRNFHIKPFYIF